MKMRKYRNAFSPGQMRDMGFLYMGAFDGEDMYEYKFPCFPYGRRSRVLTANVIVLMPSGEIRINVYNGVNIYPPYILRDKVHEKLNRIIDKNIERELHRIGLIPVGRIDKEKKR